MRKFRLVAGLGRQPTQQQQQQQQTQREQREVQHEKKPNKFELLQPEQIHGVKMNST